MVYLYPGYKLELKSRKGGISFGFPKVSVVYMYNILLHVQPHDQPWGQTKCEHSFQVKGQGQRANELKPLSCRLMVVGSSF